MTALRPPGARPGAQFSALCIRCGRCIASCPHRSLVPAAPGLSREVGLPQVHPRSAPCLLCMACPPICPTGALAPLTNPREVRMGKAVVDAGRCYAAQGILCRTCVDECPLQAEAISQDDELRPVIAKGCVGCGVCEQRCPADPPAIVVRGSEARE